MRAHLHERAAYQHIRDDFARNSAGGNAGRGFARRRAPAAAIIADAVFGVIGEIGMTRAVGIADIAVIFRALIGVFDHQRNRGAGGHLLRRAVIREYAGEDFDLIRLAALGGEARLAGFAAIKLDLNIGFGQRDQRRATINHAANRNAVAFAKGGDAEEMAETVMRHG